MVRRFISSRKNPNGSMFIEIPTLEGIMKAAPGDFIIKGVNGELYPCKADIFEKTYDQSFLDPYNGNRDPSATLYQKDKTLPSCVS